MIPGKTIIVTILFFCLISNVKAQDKKLLDSLNRAIELAKTDSAKAATMEILRVNYHMAGKYEEEMKTLLKILDIYKKTGNKDNEADALNHIGMVYVALMDNNKALEYIQMSRAIMEKSENKQGLAKVYANLGSVYQNLKKQDTALVYQFKALEIFEKAGEKRAVGMLYNNIGSVYDQKADYKKAIEYFEYSLAIKKEMYDSIGMMYTYGNLGTTHSRMKNYPKALDYEMKCLAIAQAKNIPQAIMMIHSNLAKTYENMGQFNKAYNEEIEYAFWRDSIIAQKSIEQINSLQEQYNAEKREQDILKLQQKNDASNSLAEKRKLYLIIAVVSSLLFLSILLLFIVYSKNKKKQQEIEHARNKAEFEQKALRAQMNPHFIFNALNSIQHYILSNETQYAYDYLAKFSKLIRQVLVNSEHNTISLKKELELMRLYVDLEQRRFKNRFEYEIKYDEDLLLDDIVIPVMLIQPFVENAIWHGIMNLDETKKGKLLISLDLQNDVLRISVEDNGVGREKSAQLKTNNEHESVGMLFSQKRLEILKSLNDMDTRIVMTDLRDENGTASGTRVELFLSIKI